MELQLANECEPIVSRGMDLSSRVRVCQDADGSGTIDCDEFDQTFVLKAKFAEIDTDGSGELDANELATLFESMGKPVSVRAQL